MLQPRKNNPKINQTFHDKSTGLDYYYTGTEWKLIPSHLLLQLKDLDYIFKYLENYEIVELVLSVDRFKWNEKTTKTKLLKLLSNLTNNKDKIYSILLEMQK